MSGVRVLVGTRKGAFILTADGKREDWQVTARTSAAGRSTTSTARRPIPTGCTRRSPSGWFGQVIQRSDDGGAAWKPVGNDFAYEGEVGEHLWYDGTPRPWEFKRIWHLEPSRDDPDTVYAGAEDAALYRSTDGGQKWQELTALRTHQSGAAVAAGRRRHVPAHDHPRPGEPGPDLRRDLRGRRVPHRRRRRDLAADQQGPALRADPRRGRRGRPLRAPHRHAPVPAGHAVHAEALGRACAPTTPADRGARSAATCRPTSASRSRCTPTSRRPSTSCRSRATPSTTCPEGKLRVYRSRTGGDEWEPLTNGLPQANCYVNVLRDAMAVDTLDECGIYFGTTGGQVYGSADGGDTLDADRPRPAGGAVGRGPGAAVIRVVLPAHLKNLAQVSGEVRLDDRRRRSPSAGCSTRSRSEYPMLLGTIRDRQHRPAARVRAVLRVRGGPVQRVPRHPAAGAGRHRRGAVPHHRRDGRRLGRSRSPTDFCAS